MPKERTVTITREAYLRMYRAELELQALEDAGVDNWPGRDYVEWAKIEAAMAQVEVDTP